MIDLSPLTIGVIGCALMLVKALAMLLMPPGYSARQLADTSVDSELTSSFT